MFFLFLWLIIFTYTHTEQPSFLTTGNGWAEQTLQSLSLSEKIGQLFFIAVTADQTRLHTYKLNPENPYNMTRDHVISLIEQYHVGGIVFLYTSDPLTQILLTKKYQEKAKIPLLIAQDLEWGLSMRLNRDPAQVVLYPHHMTLGAITNDEYIYRVGKEIGNQCVALGIHMNLAPVLDVNNNPNNSIIGDRSFGDNPHHVAHLGSLFAQGLHDAGILSCGKHFPGHGDTALDSHYELPVIDHSFERLNTLELIPFKHMIQCGIQSLMNAHLYIPALEKEHNKPASMSYSIVTNLLQKELNFEGLIITDGLGMQAITHHYKPGQLEIEALLAGNDILLCPLDVPQAHTLIMEAIAQNIISQQDLDQRVLKILKAKEWAFAHQKKYSPEDALAFIIRTEAYELQQELYRNAITLVKNSSNIIFSPNLVNNSITFHIGKSVESMNKSSYPHEYFYSTKLQAEEFSQALECAQQYDTIIIHLANMNKRVSEQFGISPNTFNLINFLKNMNKTIILIIFGTPYSVPLVSQVDTLIVAYEDVPPAHNAVYDILTGSHLARGTLPILPIAHV